MLKSFILDVWQGSEYALQFILIFSGCNFICCKIQGIGLKLVQQRVKLIGSWLLHNKTKFISLCSKIVIMKTEQTGHSNFVLIYCRCNFYIRLLSLRVSHGVLKTLSTNYPKNQRIIMVKSLSLRYFKGPCSRD